MHPAVPAMHRGVIHNPCSYMGVPAFPHSVTYILPCSAHACAVEFVGLVRFGGPPSVLAPALAFGMLMCSAAAMCSMKCLPACCWTQVLCEWVARWQNPATELLPIESTVLFCRYCCALGAVRSVGWEPAFVCVCGRGRLKKWPSNPFGAGVQVQVAVGWSW